MFAFKRSNSDNKVHVEGAQDLVMPPPPPSPSPEQSSSSPPSPEQSSSSPISQLPSPPKSPSTPVQRRGSGVWTATGNNTIISPFVNRHEIEISFPSSESKEKDENFNRTVDEYYNEALDLITDLLKKKKSNNVHMEPTKIVVKPVVKNTPRPRQPATYNSEQLEPVDIPSDADFSFLNKSDKDMIESAYHTVNRMEKWDYLRRYSPSKDTGYMFDHDPTIEEITNAINDNWDGGHSGCSMGYTMRRIQYIANNGFQNFKQDYLYN